MSVGCPAVDTLDCVTTSVACKSTAANLQSTIQMFPTARRDCENEGDLKVREISMFNRGGGRSFERFFLVGFYWNKKPDDSIRVLFEMLK